MMDPASPLSQIDDCQPLHCVTPLVFSQSLSQKSGHNVYLKLETQQVTGSFKPRGIGRSCWAAVQKQGRNTHLICASGGNAGIAAAYSAHVLQVKCTVFVHDRTEQFIVDKIQSYGAQVIRAAGGWDSVNADALSLAEVDPSGVYIHPFEGDDLIQGHSSIIKEIYDQLPGLTVKTGMTSRPDVVCCAVGGGGMIRGIMLDLSQRSLNCDSPPCHILAVTTLGADSFSQSLSTQETFVELPNAFSVAKSLAAKACSVDAVRYARKYAATGEVPAPDEKTSGKFGRYLTTVRIDDAHAGSAAWKASRELQHPIEIACGAALVPVYKPEILRHIVKEKGLPEKLNVVIVVCGGSRVDCDTIMNYEERYHEGFGSVIVDDTVLQT